MALGHQAGLLPQFALKNLRAGVLHGECRVVGCGAGATVQQAQTVRPQQHGGEQHVTVGVGGYPPAKQGQ